MSEILDRLKTALKGRYDVERQIGEGGMATVFLARDLKHSRLVAIKVLRPELTASIGTQRFLQEIDIAAKLQHPHILPVYDSGEADGILYYVMPYVEGESLKDRMAREGRIPWADAVEITREVASALDYAHRRGVIHRDIKPANILLSEGHAVVADFGIARAIIGSGGQGGLTQAGMAIGTPWYMSPEQATGDPNVDGRSDVYALGCVLYEMMDGKPPFDGPTAQAIIAKTISAPLPKLEALELGAPKTIQTQIARAMAKDAGSRYQTAGEFAEALRAGSGEMLAASRGRRWVVPVLAAAVVVLALALILSRPAASGRVVSGADVIAVLPFNATGADVSYLSEGMVDLLSTNLNGVGGIRTVDSRTVISAWKKRGGADGLAQEQVLALGREVDAGSVLTGTVVEAGSAVRITAGLYRTDGDEIGRIQLDGPADNILPLVDSLSLLLLRTVWRSREPLPSVSVAGITSGSMDAIREYLKGAGFYREGRWDSAIVAFERAVTYDSTFALAHYHVASSYGWTVGLGSGPQQTAIESAVRFADRLPARDRSIVMAYDHFRHNDMAALDTMRAYVRQYPSDAVGWHLLGDLQYHARGMLGLSLEDYLEPFDRAIELDSSFSPAVVHPVDIALQLRDQDRYRRYLRLLPDAVQQAPQLHALGPVMFGEDETAAAVVDSLAAQASLSSMAPLLPFVRPAVRAHALDVLDSVIGTFTAGDNQWLQAKSLQWMTSLMVGHPERAAEITAELSALNTPVGQQLGRLMSMQAAVAGYADPARVEAGITQMMAGLPANARQFGALFLAQLALAQGDAGRARELLDAQQPTDITNQGFTIRIPALYRATRGWAALVAGDTTTAITEMQAGLETYGPLFTGFQSSSGILRLQLASAMARQPATREDGINRLRNSFVGDPELLPIAYLTAAQILDEAGESEQARLAYADFLDLWQDPDPALQSRVQAARTALARVAAENNR